MNKILVPKFCPKCKADNRGKRFFCQKCGSYMYEDKLENKDASKLPELKIMRIIENLKYVPHEDVVWNNIIDNYVKDVEKFKALYCTVTSDSEFAQATADKMDNFLDLCRNSDFQIAFVGTIKTGKSTLINALLGRNYASMAVTPETAALTKFRSSEKDYVKVTFYDHKEWDELWKSRKEGSDAFMREYESLNAESIKAAWIGHDPFYEEVDNNEIENKLTKWSSSKHAEHYFVKEIEVGISNLSKDFPSQVVFVDTPGLSDPVAYRSKITRDYIKRANAVFVCVDAQKVYSEEMNTISDVFSYSHNDKNKVHIIATHWDAMNYPEEDWKEQKRYLISQLVGPAYFQNAEIADSNIDYTAAYVHNVCRDYATMNEDELKKAKKFLGALFFKFDLDITEFENNIAIMKSKANINSVHNTIKEKLVDNYKNMLSKDIEMAYRDIVSSLGRVVRETRKLKIEQVDISRADIDVRRAKTEEVRLNYEELKKCKDELTKSLAAVDKKTKDNLDAIITAMNKPPRKDAVKSGKSIFKKLKEKINGM